MCQTADIPAQLIIEHGALKNIMRTDIRSQLDGRRVTMISGTGKTCDVAKHLAAKIESVAEQVNVLPCKENTIETIHRLEREVLESAEIVIGVGGGKALDVAKVVGTRSGLPVILDRKSVV